MFSWHALHSLYPELALCGLAIFVICYRTCGGSNEWLRTHGLILTSFYAVGGIAYDELEGWPLLDSVYFLTVTITTVGYGDLCPVTDAGKLFTVVYAMVGIVFVFAALTPLVDALMWVKDVVLIPCAPPAAQSEGRGGSSLTLEQQRARAAWGYKYAAALAGPGIIFVLGLVIGFTVMDLKLVDSIYWSMITMTTIGYGDISATSKVQMAVLCLYLPTAVAALADAISAVQVTQHCRHSSPIPS